jgi:class 3 adenylate cyclase/tetratricopeptide (TPR) repeat protein
MSASEQRKTVTAVFCDVVGSTALGETADPEAMRRVLVRYFEGMRGIVEAHGGSVQKFIGDAVVAIFGVPAVHEDDALRALRAAVEMRDALPGLGVEARLGVNTGEVVTSDDDTLVTGDAINVAARLQQSAAPGEVLVGAETLALAGSAPVVEELGPLELKGKAAPVAAFRLVLVGEPPERSHRGRFVGRGEQLGLLRALWESARVNDRCEFVTIVGEPGVGKSRLVGEFVAAEGARVVTGRCLSYGEGITYYPVVEAIKQLDTIAADPSVAATIESLRGESGAPTSADEIAWAFRRLLAQAAPLVVVFDDIQWGEETFLDLVEQVGLLSAGAPILLVCMARPELVELRPRWPIALRLEPLLPGEVDELLSAEVPGALRRRIAEVSGGNPLFLTEMIAMAAEAEEDIEVPPTLKALLAARLDRLEPRDREVLECGAVEGELFHSGAIQALSLSDAPVASRLAELVRKALIRPDEPVLPAEEGFRFCHVLIRDAAYHALPKGRRAELHERFANWLDLIGGSFSERDELVGYHLERACRYRLELGDEDERTRELADRGAGRLAGAGLRARSRGDYHAVASLLVRATSLMPLSPERARLQVELAYALYEAGRDAEASAAISDAREAAASLGDRGTAALVLVHETRFQGSATAEDSDGAILVFEQAVETFAGLGEDRARAVTERLLGLWLAQAGRIEGIAVLEQALRHAEEAGDPSVRREVIGTLLGQLKNGPTPVEEGIERCERLLASSRSDRLLEALIERILCAFYAMAGRFDEAVAAARRSSLVLDELDQRTVAVSRDSTTEALQLAGDPDGAEHELLRRYTHFRDTNFERRAIDSAYLLANFYCDEGRWEEAERFASLYRDSPVTIEHGQGASRLATEARLAAHAGRLAEAVALARRAVAGAETANRVRHRTRAWFALAEVQRAAGNEAAAQVALERLLELCEQKGNVVTAARVRELMRAPASRPRP